MKRAVITHVIPYIPGLLIISLIFVIYIPALDIYLIGDDFEWLNTSYSGWRNPLGLLTLISYFFRPLVKLSYLFNYTFFTVHTVFYSATTLLIHLINVFLLYVLILRIRKQRSIAALIALTFGISSKYIEITLWSAARPDSMLLIFILATLILVNNFEATFRQQIILILLTLGAVGSKETWILMPFLVFCFLWLVKKHRVKIALVLTIPLFVLLILYLAVFVGIPLLSNTQTPTAYADANIGGSLIKFCHLMTRYIGVSELYSGKAWQSLVIILAFTAFGYWLIRRKNWLAVWGMIWMFLTVAISLPIYYTPSRYNYLPLMGFWIMVIAFLEREITWMCKTFKISRNLVYSLIIIALASHTSYQVMMLQWEIKDYKFHGNSHKTVVKMYNKIKRQIPFNRPIIFINQGTRKPIIELTKDYQGYPKLLFARKEDIWELINFAALANFAGEPFKRLMIPIPQDNVERIFQKKDFTTILFTDQGFSLSAENNKKLYQFYSRHKWLPDNVRAYQFIPVQGNDISGSAET